MQLFLVEIRPLAVLLTSLPFLVHGQSATVNAAIGSAGRPFECPVSIEDCPAVPLPAALSFQSPSEASSTAGPLSHVLHSTLWLVTQTVFRSSKPVKICTKLLLRVLFQFSWILWSIANVLLTPLKRFFNSVVIEPALFVLGLLQSVSIQTSHSSQSSHLTLAIFQAPTFPSVPFSRRCRGMRHRCCHRLFYSNQHQLLRRLLVR